MPTFQDLDPATGESIADVTITTSGELAAAVARARAAAPAWAALPTQERLAPLRELPARIEARAEELAHLITREMGKTLQDARGEIAEWVNRVPHMLEEVSEALEPRVLSDDRNDTVVVHEPHGVVAAITPWNFPLGMPIDILVPALATGNTVVLKPSEHTPLVGAEVAALFDGLVPEGALELVQGDGEVGAALVASDVDMIGFVGSRATGKRIMQSAAGDLKRLVLELGGKDPMLIFADADVERAARCAVENSLRNTGQVCCSVERVFVADEIADEFEVAAKRVAESWAHGPGTDTNVKMGPLVSDEQRAKVIEQVDDAAERGARVLLGGASDEGAGWFYPATVLADVAPPMRLAHEETFGPVVCLSRFDGSDDEGVRLANDTEYGLGANVWTGDVERGQRVARRIHAGQVGINRFLSDAPGAPWVGARQSGFGFLGGVEGHLQFTVPKTICAAKR